MELEILCPTGNVNKGYIFGTRNTPAICPTGYMLTRGIYWKLGIFLLSVLQVMLTRGIYWKLGIFLLSVLQVMLTRGFIFGTKNTPGIRPTGKNYSIINRTAVTEQRRFRTKLIGI